MNHNDIARELLERYYSDADRLVHRGVASALDVDLGMRLGAGYPAGPFEARGSAPRAASTSGTNAGIALVFRQHRRVRSHGVRDRGGRGPRRQRRHSRRPHRRIHRSLAGIDHRESRPLRRPRPSLGAGCRGHRGPHRLRAERQRHSGRRRRDHRGGRRRPPRQAGRPRAGSTSVLVRRPFWRRTPALIASPTS